jgi:hypothetical protein
MELKRQIAERFNVPIIFLHELASVALSAYMESAQFQEGKMPIKNTSLRSRDWRGSNRGNIVRRSLLKLQYSPKRRQTQLPYRVALLNAAPLKILRPHNQAVHRDSLKLIAYWVAQPFNATGALPVGKEWLNKPMPGLWEKASPCAALKWRLFGEIGRCERLCPEAAALDSIAACLVGVQFQPGVLKPLRLQAIGFNHNAQRGAQR